MTIDPITLEVLTQGLISIVREMRATVCRTASSVAIYDAKDFSCGLFAPDSQVVRTVGGYRLPRRSPALVGALGHGEVRPRSRARRRHPLERSLHRAARTSTT